MARLLCIDDFAGYAEMIALMLEQKGGHEVRIEIVPFDLAEIRRYRPEAVLLNLSRKTEAIGQPLFDFYTQVSGAKALQALRSAPELCDYPLLLTAIGLAEAELPPGFDYLAFIEVPSRFDYLLTTVDRIVATGGDHLAKG